MNFNNDESSLFLLKNINQFLLSEASKLKILIDKEGLNEEQAKVLDELCGPLSVWMLSKFKEYQKHIFRSWEKDVPIDSIAIERINSNNLILNSRQQIQGIMDWIRVGLNGNVKPYKDLSLKQLKEKSQEWHNSLGVSSGEINYVEKHPIIADFRNQDGEGFYWADLETNNSPEECQRMGHCGRTGQGNTIYSLREVKKISGGKYFLNKSHLTASVRSDGTLLQLKGPKNSKPKNEYHQYILPLFYIMDDGDDYFISGFGSEYASEQDFKLTDLPESVISELYKNRPDLFESRGLQRKLIELGIIEDPKIDYTFVMNIEPRYINHYIKGDYVVSRRKVKRKSPAGVEYDQTIETTLFEAIISGEGYMIWDNYDADWKSAIDYYIDDRNTKEIKEKLKEVAKTSVSFNEEEFNSLSLEDLIEEYDDDWKIRSSVQSAVNACERDDYESYVYNKLKDALEELGEIIEMDDRGVKVKIDLSKYLNNLYDSEIDDYFDRCNDRLECVFEELLENGYIENPEVYIDDRYSPDVSDDCFNSYLYDDL